MTIHIPQPRRLRHDDYLAFPADGQRHEVLDGEHVVSAAPVPRHQIVILRLGVQLQLQVVERGLGLVIPSPCVELGEHDIVEPDLVVLLGDRTSLVRDDRIVGTPSLLIEVLSPSTRYLDRGRKKARYAASGVPEYWIVDPQRATVEQWRLEGASYELAATATESLSLVALPEVSIDLRKVW